MPEIKLGTIILFLIPGLLAYCAFFGIFVSKAQMTVAPPPPAANSIKTLTIILIASIVVHGATALLISLNAELCSAGRCPVTPPAGYDDFYRLAVRLTRGPVPEARDLGYVIAIAFAQGVVAYAAIRLWLRWCATHDRLPDWLYGWSVDIANQLDNQEKLLLAYVLSTVDVDGKSVIYCGSVRDVAWGPDGGIARITLIDCERYLISLGDRWTEVEPDPLALFRLMTIEAANIRNIAFETLIVELPDRAGSAPIGPMPRPQTPAS